MADSTLLPDQTGQPGIDALFEDGPAAQSESAPAADAADADSDSDDAGLFGDDDDDNEAAATRAVEPEDDDDGLTAEERARRTELEYGEDDNEEMEVVKKSEAIAQVELANFGMPQASKVWHARLPNFLALQPQAFDDVMWEPEDSEEQLPPTPSQGEGAADATAPGGTTKSDVPDENVIRWRWVVGADGKPVKESNARTIRWSDGSLSLQVGSELFDISATVDHSGVLSSAPGAAAPLPSKLATTTGLSVADPLRGHGLTYLTAEHSYQGLIEAQASVYGTLTFRPTTLQSNTHRRLAGNIAGRYVKARGVKIAALPEEDPEKKKMEREKEELARAKKLNKKAQASARGASGRKGARKATRFSDGEGDEDTQGSGVGGAARRPRAGYSDSEDDEDGFIEHDTDDSDAEPSAKRSKKRASPSYSDDEPDEMDEAEARIEQDERRRKERKKEGRQHVEEEPAPAPRRRLVVESDEEDE
ncbi:hypothetical protein RQP46_008956 [Phenoliferia psychrophenolica]